MVCVLYFLFLSSIYPCFYGFYSVFVSCFEKKTTYNVFACFVFKNYWRRKYMSRFLSERKAQVGIGTLIIFIAMILVAAVAAGVLLRTSGSLQQKAAVTGEQSIKEVSTQLKAISTTGWQNVTTANQVDGLIITTSLAAGSGDIRFTDIILTYHSGDIYIAGINYTNVAVTTPADVADTAAPAANFGVNVLNGDSDEILEVGETIELHVFIEESDGTDRPLSSDTTFTLTLQPKAGQVSTVKKTAPSSISTNYITEWG
jgi:flagellin FlaB